MRGRLVALAALQRLGRSPAMAASCATIQVDLVSDTMRPPGVPDRASGATNDDTVVP